MLIENYMSTSNEKCANIKTIGRSERRHQLIQMSHTLLYNKERERNIIYK